VGAERGIDAGTGMAARAGAGGKEGADDRAAAQAPGGAAVRGRRPPALRALAVVLAALVIQSAMVATYAWSAARLAPRHVPIAVAGPAVAVSELVTALNRQYPGAFDLAPAASEDAARRAITARGAYGAIIIGAPAPRVLIASAASPELAQVLTAAADHLAGVKPPVTDVVPGDPHDPYGAAFGFSLLPLVITSIIAGVMLSLLVASGPLRLAGLIAFALAGGAVTAAIMRTWLSILPARYVAVGAVTGLVILAISAGVAGLGAVARRAGRAGRMGPGLALGAAAIMLFGNPFSGTTSAPEMLPRPWGEIGQWLPPGAGSTLLRSVSYFDGARSGGAWTVLGIWAAAGLALVLAGHAARPAASIRRRGI
jgi:hypothetical protein